MVWPVADASLQPDLWELDFEDDPVPRLDDDWDSGLFTDPPRSGIYQDD